MTKIDEELVYFAHPYGGDDRNVERALRWLGWLYDQEPGANLIAPWIAGIALYRAQVAGGGSLEAAHPMRARNMRANLATVARCGGIVLCGGEISPGMRDEVEVLATRMITFERGEGGELLAPTQPWVADLTELGREPPSTWSQMLGRPLAYGRIAWATRANR